MIRGDSKFTHAILFVSVLWFSTGCATLKIRTEIYDDPLRASDALHARSALKALARSLDDLPARATDAAADYFETNRSRIAEQDLALFGSDLDAWRASYVDVLEESALAPLEPAREQLLGDIRETIESLPSDAGAVFDRNALKYRVAAILDGEKRYRERLDANLQRVYDANRQQAIRDLVDGAGVSPAQAESRFADYVSMLPDRIKAASIEPLRIQRERVEGTVERVPLDDARLAEIVGADCDAWRRYVNDVSARGFFGNSEFTIAMQGLGSYTLKGVVFDPSQVSQAALDSMAQAVRIAASAYGVPISSPAIQASGSSEEESSEAGTLRSLPLIEAELAAIENASETRSARKGSLFNRLVAIQSERTSARANGVAVVAAETTASQATIAALREAAKLVRAGE